MVNAEMPQIDRPGLYFYTPALNSRVGIKFLWPERFVIALAWQTKKRKFTGFIKTMNNEQREKAKAFNP